jgi:hypothetical protein
MTDPLRVRPDRVRVASLRVAETAVRLRGDLDRWLRAPAAPPPGSAAAGAAEPAARDLVAAVDRRLSRAVAALAELSTGLCAAAAAYAERDDAAAGAVRAATHPPAADRPPAAGRPPGVERRRFPP